MPKPIDSNRLHEIPLFAELTLEHRAKLNALAVSRTYNAGDLILREGESATLLGFVLEGRVSLSIGIPGRGETLISTHGVGELVGWSAMRPAGEWLASIRAVEPATLLRFEGTTLRHLASTDHEIGYHLMSGLFDAVAERLHETRLQLLDMLRNESR